MEGSKLDPVMADPPSAQHPPPPVSALAPPLLSLEDEWKLRVVSLTTVLWAMGRNLSPSRMEAQTGECACLKGNCKGEVEQTHIKDTRPLNPFRV